MPGRVFGRGSHDRVREKWFCGRDSSCDSTGMLKARTDQVNALEIGFDKGCRKCVLS